MDSVSQDANAAQEGTKEEPIFSVGEESAMAKMGDKVSLTKFKRVKIGSNLRCGLAARVHPDNPAAVDTASKGTRVQRSRCHVLRVPSTI